MFVQGLLSRARDRLVTIAGHAPLIDAARLLQSGTEMVLVCNLAGALTGVITKTDIVAQISRCQGASCTMAAKFAMTHELVLCQSKDLLHDVWTRMKVRGLKNIPVIDADCHPIGVLHARDILSALLSESESEEHMMRDYVMGVGYR